MNYSFLVDRALNDFRIVDGKMVFVRGASTVAQQTVITLKTEIGEWFLNVNFGLPYFTETGSVNDNTDNGILGGNFPESVIQSFVTAAILQVPNVLSIEILDIKKVPNIKSLTINSTVLVEDSDTNGIGTQQTFTVNIGDI